MNRMLTLPDPIVREEFEKHTGQTSKHIAEFFQWFSELFGGGVLCTSRNSLGNTILNNNNDVDSTCPLLSTYYVLITS